jgi:hypothetical protein
MFCVQEESHIKYMKALMKKLRSMIQIEQVAYDFFVHDERQPMRVEPHCTPCIKAFSSMQQRQSYLWCTSRKTIHAHLPSSHFQDTQGNHC